MTIPVYYMATALVGIWVEVEFDVDVAGIVHDDALDARLNSLPWVPVRFRQMPLCKA